MKARSPWLERVDTILQCPARRAADDPSRRISGSITALTLLTLVLLIAIPAFFVLIFASVLGEFADALGGTLVEQAAT